MSNYDQLTHGKDINKVNRVTPDGKIWTLYHNGKAQSYYTERPHCIDDQGRPNISIELNGKRVNRRICRLVIDNFGPPRPPNMECCHNDGNPKNNHISNLRWGTKKDNAQDRNKHGIQTRGESHAQTKYTESQILDIRAMHKSGVRTITISRYFKIQPGTIDAIINRRTWKHI